MKTDIENIIEKLKKHKNILLYGPPGTGKTKIVMEVLNELKKERNESYNCYDTVNPFVAISKPTNEFVYEWCTFHPNYSYENFVVGLEPIVAKGCLGYKYSTGPFFKLAKQNYIDGKKTLLVIDEINRTNTDDVFGNVISLLDSKNRKYNSVNLPEKINIDETEVDKLKINDSFFIIATMNSLDKSVSPLDYGIKRRFITIEISPNEEILSMHLDKNLNLTKEIKEITLDIFKYFNKNLREYVGKEYEFGQGYFWNLVEAEENYIEILSDIIKYKILPHIKDVFPREYYLELFGIENMNKVYFQSSLGNELSNLSIYEPEEIINFMGNAAKSKFYLDVRESINKDIKKSFNEYQNLIINKIYKKLKLHKNVILSGCSGSGKSSIINLIRNKFMINEAMHWHSSTSYEDVLEGISATLNSNGEIEYRYKKGALLKLLENKTNIDSLLIIEDIDRSNAAENFGELITLLEADKRDNLSIKLQDNILKIPQNMYLISSMNTLGLSKFKLDSALKRRFVIIELYPDYNLLNLWFELDEIPLKQNSKLDSRNDFLNFAVGILRGINIKIIKCLGNDFQIGHAIFWELKDETNLNLDSIFDRFDEVILPLLSDYINDQDSAYQILGDNSPLISVKQNRVEILSLKMLNEIDKLNALWELYNYG